MSGSEGLIHAFAIDAEGRASALDWDGLEHPRPDGTFLWVHLDRTSDRAETWLAAQVGLDPIAVEALLAEETRPRASSMGDAMLTILRGVNLNPGSEPEDMVSVRLWIEKDRVVSLQARPVMAVRDVAAEVGTPRGPKTPGDLLAALADRLIERMGPVIDELEESLDAAEDALIEAPAAEIRSELGALRRKAIALRRYLGPQRDVIARLCGEDMPWLSRANRARLRECSDRITRYVENLDAARERAGVTHDELTARLSEQMNRTMYLLSIVAAVFLPLSFATGLLGINVGGIPGAENSAGFAVVCWLLGLIGGVQLWIFWRWRWLSSGS